MRSYALPLVSVCPFGLYLCVLDELLRLAFSACPGRFREKGTAPPPFFWELEVDVLGRRGGGPHCHDVEVDGVQDAIVAVRLVRKNQR